MLNSSTEDQALQVVSSAVFGGMIGLIAWAPVFALNSVAHALSHPGHPLALIGYFYQDDSPNPIGPLIGVAIPVAASGVLASLVKLKGWPDAVGRLIFLTFVFHVTFPLVIMTLDYHPPWIGRGWTGLMLMDQLVASVPTAAAALALPVLAKQGWHERRQAAAKDD
jgi:hypothetical protein